MTSTAYATVDPSTGETIRTFTTTTDSSVADAIAAAHEAFQSWRELDVEKRAAIVKRVGELFVERAPELAYLAHLEMGKALAEGEGEAAFCGAIFDYFSTVAAQQLADEPLAVEGVAAVIQKRPVGVLLGIQPWNFPFYQVARFAAPNLMLGNTVLLKHAESVPQCALAIQELMDDAGVPAGVYTNLFASHEQVETIVADARVQGVSLTGSARAGAVVGALAGRHLKKCVLELGGSDPHIVLDADDVEGAADLAWGLRMFNAGQACNSNKRIIVGAAIFEDFVERLVANARVGADLAPMSSRRAAEALHEQVEDAVAKGASLHAGGTLSEGPSAYYPPTVLTGVTPEMRAYSEELFGPVAVVYQVASEDEAVTLANDTAYGLGAAVFSSDAERARRVADRLDVGMAHANSAAVAHPALPFGGVKGSGFGRELGPLAMDEFVNKRVLVVAG